MNPVFDERAYWLALDDFVARRVGAAVFIPRFRHLRECDRAARHEQAGLDGRLDAIDILCETYARCLPSGGGYRVSEEQFRKEVQSLASEWPPAGPGES